ncbi:hypothetical protein NNO_1768 [Hydrogenimonas sp.]|nr:hypothetical protein NNO_1768 [Hydrogenimonas sp.]
MQIPLRKIHETPKQFHLKKDSVEFFGSFRRSGRHEVLIEGEIKGEADFLCDRCGSSFSAPVDESFALEVVDRPVKVEESLDMIECLDGIIDFDSVCRSEIASIESEYHLCPKCEGEEDFEIEI